MVSYSSIITSVPLGIVGIFNTHKDSFVLLADSTRSSGDIIRIFSSPKSGKEPSHFRSARMITGVKNNYS